MGMSLGIGLGLSHRRTPRAAVAGPFDALGGLYAALDFGGRRLIGAWTGPTRRLRRGSDSAEQDIYVNAAGAQVLADGTPLLTWAGSDTAYLAAVYDQSGGGHSAVQTTAAAQPVAVQAGAVVTLGGRPAALFQSRYMVLTTAAGFGRAAGNLTAALVAEKTDTTIGQLLNVTVGTGIGGRFALSVSAAGNFTAVARAADTDTYQTKAVPCPVAPMRLIARCRYVDGQVDMGTNGSVSTLTWGAGFTVGLTADTDSAYLPRIGSAANGTEYFNGSLSVLALSRTAPDTAELDAALQGAMA